MRGVNWAVSLLVVLIATAGLGCEDSQNSAGTDGSVSDMSDAGGREGRADAGAMSAASPCDGVQCGPNGYCKVTLENKPLCLCDQPSRIRGIECEQSCPLVTGMTEFELKSFKVTFNATYDGKPVPTRKDGKKVQIQLFGLNSVRTDPNNVYILEDGVPASVTEGVYALQWSSGTLLGEPNVGPEPYDGRIWLSRRYGVLTVHADRSFTVDFPKLVRAKGKIELPYSWGALPLLFVGRDSSVSLMTERAADSDFNFNESDGTFDAWFPPGNYDLSSDFIQNEFVAPRNGPLVRNALVVKAAMSDKESVIRIPSAKVMVKVNINGAPFACDDTCSGIGLASNALELSPRQVSMGQFEFIVPAGTYAVRFRPTRQQYPFAEGASTIGTVVVPGDSEVGYNLQYVRLAGLVKIDGQVVQATNSDIQVSSPGVRIVNAPDRSFTAHVVAGKPVIFNVHGGNGLKGTYRFPPQVFNVGDENVTLDLNRVRAKVSVALSPPDLAWPPLPQGASTDFGLLVAPAIPSVPDWVNVSVGKVPSPFDDFVFTGPHWIGYSFGFFGHIALEKVSFDANTSTYAGTVRLSEFNARITADGKPIAFSEFEARDHNVYVAGSNSGMFLRLQPSANGEIRTPLPSGEYFVVIRGKGPIGCFTIGAKP